MQSASRGSAGQWPVFAALRASFVAARADSPGIWEQGTHDSLHFCWNVADVVLADHLLFSASPNMTAGSAGAALTSRPSSIGTGNLDNQWIVTPRPNPKAAIRLICVPHAGGGVSSFRGWSERVGAAEVGVVQLPGRGSRLREPVLESLPTAAAAIVEEIARGPVVPTVLFGHGLGALIAFETARRLEARGWPMLALFVSGRRAPALPETGPLRSQLPLEQLITEARRRSDAVAPDAALDKELIELMIPGLRADFAMIDGYRYQPAPPLRCPIVACCGAGDPYASRPETEAWRSETTARFSLHTFTGGHFYLQREQEAVTALVANQLSVMVSARARWAAAH
jgi:surfactin synthase thioesterase subunit